MKAPAYVLLSLSLISALTYAINPVSSAVTNTLAPSKEKISYAFGAMMGQRFKQFNIDIDLDAYLKGIKDSMSGKSTMTDAEIQATIMAFQKELSAKRMAEFKAMKVKNQKENDAFFAKNKSQPGVVTLPDGLQYKILQSGTGPKPEAQDTITVDYSGTTLDGKEFDSSYKRGKPMTAVLQFMIPGWVEALKLMNEGATWEIYVPANLAYGDAGAPPLIGPAQALIFKIKLIAVKKTNNIPNTNDKLQPAPLK